MDKSLIMLRKETGHRKVDRIIQNSRKQISSCLECRGTDKRDRREGLQRQRKKLGCNENVYYLDCGDDFTVGNICQKLTKSYTSNMLSLLYINYTSMKLF